MSSSSILFKISLVVKLEKHKNTSTNYNISIIYIFWLYVISLWTHQKDELII